MIYSRDKRLLFPAFRASIEMFEAELQGRGLPFHLFMAFRDPWTQQELYEQGRSTPGKIVTNARGLPAPESWHCYGLACDYVLDSMPEKPGLQWSWETRNVDFNQDGTNDWQQMGAIAESLGLQWGGRWKRFPDLPHIQNNYGLSIVEAKQIYLQDGIKAVWRECGA